MTKLTHANSPLEQARQQQRVSLAKSKRPLSLRDQATVKRLLNEKYDYVHDELFELPAEEAERKIFDEAPEIEKPDTSWYHPVMDNFTETRSAQNSGTVLLTAEQERALFLQFNYCRFRTYKLREQLQTQEEIDPAEARELLSWYRRGENYRDQIAQTNLALVLAMAKRTRMSEVDFADLVSEGNMALLRAVDKFDVSRGFKFSTYACRAILKAFSRSGVKLSKYRQMFPTDFDPKLERSNHGEQKRDEHEDDCVDELKTIIHRNRAELSDIEQEVITHRFALGKPEDEANPLTLEQVGRIIGVTKERVRQIQNKALEKIRHTLEDEFLD
ncbi:MAG: sigma-70 family RNA polymerase sigma factor [Phycisphaeraceae bacterium]